MAAVLRALIVGERVELVAEEGKPRFKIAFLFFRRKRANSKFVFCRGLCGCEGCGQEKTRGALRLVSLHPLNVDADDACETRPKLMLGARGRLR